MEGTVCYRPDTVLANSTNFGPYKVVAEAGCGRYFKELVIQTRVFCPRPSKHGSLILSTLYVRQQHHLVVGLFRAHLWADERVASLPCPYSGKHILFITCASNFFGPSQSQGWKFNSFLLLLIMGIVSTHSHRCLVFIAIDRRRRWWICISKRIELSTIHRLIVVNSTV